MSTEEIKALDRRFPNEAWNRGNLAIVDERLAHNYIGHAPSDLFRGPMASSSSFLRFGLLSPMSR